jgi:hypothetical protein
MPAAAGIDPAAAASIAAARDKGEILVAGIRS